MIAWPKRARYYQGILDTTSLYAGKKIKYNRLAKAVIIFINDFDVYGLGYYKYSFHRWCDDNKGLVMGRWDAAYFPESKMVMTEQVQVMNWFNS